MTARRQVPRRHGQPHPWEPLTMTWREVADTVFRTSEEWLHNHMPEDFPKPDSVLNVFARAAVERWVAKRFGLDTVASATKDAIALERLRNGKNDRAIPRHPAA